MGVYDRELEPGFIDPLLQRGYVLLLSFVTLWSRMHADDLQAPAAQFLVHLLEVGSNIMAYVAAALVCQGSKKAADGN